MTVLASDVLAAAESQLGKAYRVSGCRCAENCSSRDCSGLVVFACNHCGMNVPCTSSFGLARWGQASGTLISEERALHTPGALLIRNGFGAPNGPRGSNGHVVFSKGDGVSTVEAMGTRYGVVRGRAAGRGFETFMLIPGVSYDAPQPKATFDVLTFQCPNKPAKGNQIPRADFYPAGANPVFPDGVILLHDGASLNGDAKTKDPNVRMMLPTGGKWVTCGTRGSVGLYIVNDQGATSPPSSLAWS